MKPFFFNLQILEEKTQCDPAYLVAALYKFYKGQLLPKHRYELYKPIPGMRAGHSFLLNPEPFFRDTRTDINHRYQYVVLAARRDYFMYKVYRATYLDLGSYPDLDLPLLQANPLLELAQNKLHFKYEN